MYDINNNTYTTNKTNSYLVGGLTALSFISYSEAKTDVSNYLNSHKVISPSNNIDNHISSNELTKHALRLTEISLKDDWQNEDDEHWASFL